MAGRPKGARGPRYEQKRRDLITKLKAACLTEPGRLLSLREMAGHADVSLPTLKHYFADRQAIVRAILEQSWTDAAAHLGPDFDPEESLGDRIGRELQTFALAFRHFGLDRLYIWGLTEGLADGQSGPAYLQFFLEPALQAAEGWLTHYQDQGTIDASVNIRYAALALLSPCLLLVAHQGYLGGRDVRHADLDHFLKDHAARFLAYVT